MKLSRLACLSAVVLLAACESYVQTTSGSQYLKRYETAVGQAPTAVIDADIRAAAAVEPILKFPARIGIARIESGALSPVPAEEVEIWRTMADELGKDWGTFLPISPLITALAAGAPADPCKTQAACLAETVRNIRLGAARQHVDVVLIYEVFARSETSTNPLAVTKLALIGYFLAPSENISADGYAQAVLVDVRNGYTYGYVDTVTEDAAFAVSTEVNQWTNQRKTMDLAETKAVAKLAGEVAEMAWRLRAELAEKRAEALE